MKISLSYRVTAMFLAFLMFTSSIGFSMDIHYCGNEFKSFSFYGDAEGCDMTKPEKELTRSCCQSSKENKEEPRSCCSSEEKEVSHCQNSETAKGICCHNDRFMIDNGTGFESSNLSLQEFQQILFTAIILSPALNLFQTQTKQVSYACYNPPPLLKDVTVLHQVFLL